MAFADVMLVVAAVACLAAIVVLLRARKAMAAAADARAAHAEIEAKYGSIISVDAEVAKRNAEVEAARAQAAQLVATYAENYQLFERLKAELAVVEENLEDVSCGIYKPHFAFDTSDQYRAKLEAVVQKRRDMVRAGTAAVCDTQWTVSGSAKEGERMTKQNIKVMLRAFNGEADAAIAKVTWNNVLKMEERIRKACKTINDMGTTNRIRIMPEYVELSLSELRLAYEYEQKKRDEAEEQRAIRENMREEERARREFERAQQEAATEEDRYERALKKARTEVEKATGAAVDAANAKVAELEAKLAEAHAKMERAKSMAEQTRCGYIYVISNIGSFGEDLYKIGMTRRLDPQDRVRELGDASVPFSFDVHAMMYSEDAPTLEREFHKQFNDKSVNLVNMRKEFFAVTLDEVEAFAKAKGIDLEFTRLAEAREFRETLAMRARAAAASGSGVVPQVAGEVVPFPKELSA